ncbi:hypothetical protein X777_12054, partial [Ooceraea biroi]
YKHALRFVRPPRAHRLAFDRACAFAYTRAPLRALTRDEIGVEKRVKACERAEKREREKGRQGIAEESRNKDAAGTRLRPGCCADVSVDVDVACSSKTGMLMSLSLHSSSGMG